MVEWGITIRTEASGPHTLWCVSGNSSQWGFPGDNIVLLSTCSQQKLLSSMLAPFFLFHVEPHDQQLVGPRNSQSPTVIPPVLPSLEQHFCHTAVMCHFILPFCSVSSNPLPLLRKIYCRCCLIFFLIQCPGRLPTLPNIFHAVILSPTSGDNFLLWCWGCCFRASSCPCSFPPLEQLVIGHLGIGSVSSGQDRNSCKSQVFVEVNISEW